MDNLEPSKEEIDQFHQRKADQAHYDSTRPVLGTSDSVPAPGYKHDGGKLPLHLLSTVALNKTAEVMAFGAQKYSTDAWRAGMDWSRLIGAALRHITAFNDGEDQDIESGLSHLAHAACCVMFLLEYEETFPGGDDRHSSFKAAVERMKRVGGPLYESSTYRGKSVQALRLLGESGETLMDTHNRLYPEEVQDHGKEEDKPRDYSNLEGRTPGFDARRGEQDRNKAVTAYPDPGHYPGRPGYAERGFGTSR